MIIKRLHNKDDLNLYSYYTTITKNEGVFVCQNKEKFFKLLDESTVLYKKDFSGFIVFNDTEDTRHITILYGSEAVMNELLDEVEGSLKVSFTPRNKHILEWYPDHIHRHPSYQAVPEASLLYNVLKSRGYHEIGILDTFLLDLNTFTLDEHFHKLLDDKRKEMLDVTFFNKDKHDIEYFLENINHPSWENTIIKNMEKDMPYPLLVALHNDRVVGFTGPLYKEYDGRGFFAGIGVLPTYGGRKLGTMLFFMLAHELKKMGSTFMTFYTGRENHARFIYLKAGSVIVKSSIMMVKTP